ncbi:VOC family protein [Sphingobium sp. MK2]|uniref:VOC family protein n=1 Tax=Sphingobium sp. MK2 TaxID=3116540 RepID=UPI0032E367A0
MQAQTSKLPEFSVPQADRPHSFGYQLIHTTPDNHDAVVKWYQTLFCGSVRSDAEDIPTSDLLDAGQETICIIARPDLTPPPVKMARGVLHMAWFYNSLAELVYVCRHARDNGIVPYEVMTSPVLMQIYFRDPAGNVVELGVDAHDTSRQAQDAMLGAADLRIPGKIDDWYYDLNKLIAMLEAGIPDHEIFNTQRFQELAASGRF